MKNKLVIAAAILAGSLATAGTAGAAGTNNGQSGCTAQAVALIGPPGPAIHDIKAYISPVPGHLISSVARSPKNDCIIPS
jgi:hypothetical protein